MKRRQFFSMIIKVYIIVRNAFSQIFLITQIGLDFWLSYLSIKKYLCNISLMIIRRFVAMAESVDIKAGVKNILERMELVVKNRPVQVDCTNDIYQLNNL